MKKVLLFKRIISSILSIVLFCCLLCYPVYSDDFPFTDVLPSDPYYEAVKYCYEKGIIDGTSNTTFSPNMSLSRGMFVSMMYRMSGSNEQYAPTQFVDVFYSDYFYYAVGWALHYGITDGVTDTEFAPNDDVTREQSLTFLYRYAQYYRGRSFTILSSPRASSFYDASSISTWALPAADWAVNSGIVRDINVCFSPHSAASRAQAAVFIYQYLTKVDGVAKAYFMTCFPYTVEAPSIKYSLQYMQFTVSQGLDHTVREMKFAIANSGVIFSSSHGASSAICLSDGNLSVSDITNGLMQNVELIYLSACHAGDSLIPAMYSVGGAQAAVGFSDTISATTAANGFHYFDARFFNYLRAGKTLYQAKSLTYADLIDAYGEGFGFQSIVIKGAYQYQP